jgi:hypothetical protein
MPHGRCFIFKDIEIHEIIVQRIYGSYAAYE